MPAAMSKPGVDRDEHGRDDGGSGGPVRRISR
jgi:hypothetical protein